MLMQVVIVAVCLSLLPLLIKLIFKLRLFPLVLYVILANTALAGWVQAHEAASVAIFGVITALTVLSWLVPLVRRKLAERRQMQALLRQVEIARAQGIQNPSFRKENGHFVLVTDRE